MKPILKEINLAKTTKQGGDGLESGPVYLVLYDGRFYSGRYTNQWYGLNFSGIYDAGAQYDPPGTNYSSWQKIWLIENADEISNDLELEYANSKKQYAIKAKLTRSNKPITEETPIETFMYPNHKMREPEQEDEDDEC